jgi:hypothetical protein
LSKSSESVQQSNLDPAMSRRLGALLGSEASSATSPADAVRRLSALVEVADTVTQQLSLDYQLPQLIDVIVEALDAERATLFLHDADAGELFSRVAHGDGVSEIRIPQSVGIAGSVFASGVAEIIDDAYQDARFNAEIDRVPGYCTRSENKGPFLQNSRHHGTNDRTPSAIAPCGQVSRRFEELVIGRLFSADCGRSLCSGRTGDIDSLLRVDYSVPCGLRPAEAQNRVTPGGGAE